jgi:hypothetical protein
MFFFALADNIKCLPEDDKSMETCAGKLQKK